jgi:hypothetical protein
MDADTNSKVPTCPDFAVEFKQMGGNSRRGNFVHLLRRECRKVVTDSRRVEKVFTTAKSQRPIVIAAAILLFALQVVAALRESRTALPGALGFRAFYAAGTAIRSGESHNLYQLSGDTFGRPEYEAILFAPLSFLEFRTAYILFFAVNIGLLLLCLRLLRPYFENFEKIWKWMPEAVFFCFLPITLGLVAGDDSILLLTLMVAAAVSFYRDQDYTSGIFLGLAIFGWQFALPIALTFLLWKRWKIWVGFLASTALAVLVSLLISGMGGLQSYLRITAAQALEWAPGIQGLGWKFAIPNLHCFLEMLSGRFVSQQLVITATATISLALLLWASTRTTNFALATMVAVLVSYHGSIQQAALLIIPIAFVLDARLAIFSGWTRTMTRNIVILLLISPTALYFIGRSYCWMVVLMLPTLLPLRFASSDWQPKRIAAQP